MALKKFKPTTSSQRFKVVSALDDITALSPEKSLLQSRKSSGGRNNTGKMTVRSIVCVFFKCYDNYRHVTVFYCHGIIRIKQELLQETSYEKSTIN